MDETMLAQALDILHEKYNYAYLDGDSEDVISMRTEKMPENADDLAKKLNTGLKMQYPYAIAIGKLGYAPGKIAGKDCHEFRLEVLS